MNRFPIENIDKVNSAKNADTASSSTVAEKLLTARDIVITGDLSGSSSFNGASNINISTTIKDDSHNHVISNIDNLQNTLNTINTSIDGKANSSHGTHVSFTTTVPKVAGTAAVGTATTVSRSDHVHPVQTTVNKATYADQLTTARNISLSGDVTGTISLKGTGNVTIPCTIVNSGVTAGTYGPSAGATLAYGGSFNIPCVTVSAKGQVTSCVNRTIKLPAAPTASSLGAATFGLEKLVASNRIFVNALYNNNVVNGKKINSKYFNHTAATDLFITDIDCSFRGSVSGYFFANIKVDNNDFVSFYTYDNGDNDLQTKQVTASLYVPKNKNITFLVNSGQIYNFSFNAFKLS